jgi:CubicO group peptidase (beta-lactamase class C family)
VADGIYLHREYPDSIMFRILATKLNDKEYKYSDMGFYLFKDIIENKSSLSLEDFVKQEFYAPLGLSTMGYLPKERFDSSRIVPTEFDYYFRSQLIHGDVHDMGAAMLGGVGGHAGLFSNANDLGIFMQMLLQKGEYGGQRYFQKFTVSQFTSCQYCEDDNRRGAGFDKAVLENQEGGPACDCSPSYKAYGHTGFTGTLVWADPDEQFVYVFLSNRIHPTSENKKLLEMDVRTKIMQVFYDAIRTDN